MKKALGVICLLLLVSSASAYIELYLKEGGVNNYIFDPAARNYLPYFDGCPSAEIPPGVLVDPNPMTRTFFVWGRFVNEEAGTMIFGIMPNVSLAANVQGLNIVMGQNVIYRHKKTNGLTGQRWTRWDGTNNLGINSPAAAVTANGIVDDGTNAWDLVCPYGSEGEAEFLLGAFQLISPGPVFGDLTLGLGRLGLAARDSSQSFYPEVRVGGQIVQELWYVPGQPLPGVPVTHPGPVYLSWIPEPASLLLLSLGLLLRRR
jgi:hypothetical protein